MNIIYHSTRFNIFEDSIDVEDMCAQIFDEIVYIDIFHQNNDLFAQWTFSSHVNFWFGFILATYDFLDDFDFLVREVRESFLNFEHFPSNISSVRLFSRYLSIRFFLLLVVFCF